MPTPSPRSSHAHAQSTSNTTNPRLGSMYRAVILVAGVPWEVCLQFFFISLRSGGAAPMVDAWADVHGWGNRDVGRAGLSAQIQGAWIHLNLLTSPIDPSSHSPVAHHHRLPRLNASTTNFGLRRAMRRACPSAHACTPDAAASEREHPTPQRHGVHACALSFVPLPASPRQRQRQHRVPLPAPALNAHLPVVACTSPRRD